MPHDRKNHNKMQCLILTPIVSLGQTPWSAPGLRGSPGPAGEQSSPGRAHYYASRNNHSNTPMSTANTESVISGVRPGRYTCTRSRRNRAAAATVVVHARLRPDARHSHRTEPYQKLLRNSTTKPSCQVELNNPRKGTQLKARAPFWAAKWKGESSLRISAQANRTGMARRIQRRGRHNQAAYAAAAPTISDHASVRLAINKRAGTSSNSSASTPLGFVLSMVLRMLSSRQATASHSAKTTNVSTGETADTVLSAASRFTRLVRPHTGNSGKSWYPSQHANSSRAPDGRSGEAVPRRARSRCSFTR